MPRKSPSKQTINPIDGLSQQIAISAKGKCGISISTELIKEVRSELKTLRTSDTFVLDNYVNIIVSALEIDGACSRLEPPTFTTVLLTLLHAKYSRQKERGIIILAASLHHDTHKTHALRTVVRRKDIIGEDCVRALLPHFTNILENARIRRWVGVMLLQLLDSTEKNILRIENCTEDSRRALGSMLLEEQDELLKITCGELLRALINWEFKREHLWPMGADPALYEKFPTSSLSEKHWNNEFQTYIDDLIENSSISQGSGRVYFAQALVLIPSWRKVSGEIINILFDNDISICTQTSGKIFTESLEIPFELILDATMEETVWEGVGSAAASAVDLVVSLRHSEGFVCYLNSLPVTLEGFRITIGDENDARIIADEMTEPKHYNKASQSKDVIAIGSAFETAGADRKTLVMEGDDDGQSTYYNEPYPVCLEERYQVGEEEINFGDFIHQQPPDNESGEVVAPLSSRNRELVSKDIAQPVIDNSRIDANESVPFPSSTPSTLSARVRNKRGAAVNKGKRSGKDIIPKDKVLSEDCVGMASLSVRPEVLSLEDSAGIVELSRSVISPPLLPLQPRISSEASQPKDKQKLKRVEPKPQAPIEFQKSEKSAPKPKKEPPLVKILASKSIAAPKATISRKGPKISNQSSASTSDTAKVSKSKPKPKLTSSTRSYPAAKLSKKMTSNLLISKNSASNPVLKSPGQKSRRESHGLEKNLIKDELLSTSLAGNNTVDLDTGTREIPIQEVGAYYTSRLSQALADLDRTEQISTDFGDLGQLGLLDEPEQLTIQDDDLQISDIHEAGEPSRGELIYPSQDSPKIADPLGYVNRLDVMEVQSESSPSSMSQHTPLPLPLLVANTTQAGAPNITKVSPKNPKTPTSVRRSPRLAALNRSREGSAVSSTAHAPAHHSARKPALIEESQIASHSKQKVSHNNKLPRKNESALINDRLARKTPLVSFGVKGPRNQGNIYENAPSSQAIIKGKSRKPEAHLLSPQKFTGQSASKRKHVEADTSDSKNNKRRQTLRLQKSAGKVHTMEQDLVTESRNEDYHAVSRINPSARSNGKYGSQGSRVNENGSPREHDKSRKKLPTYEAVVRKALTDMKTMTNDNGGNASDYIREEVFNIVESGGEIFQEHPANLPSKLKSRPLLPPPIEGAVDQRLPREKKARLRFSQAKAEDLHHSNDTMADPFIDPNHETKQSSFSKCLQYYRQTPIRRSRDNPAPIILRTNAQTRNEDPETTLVDVENENPLQECSSSSDVMSDSSNETQNRRQDEAAQADLYREQRDLWRMALKPHQRGILDILDQVSSDLVLHLIDHEQAIDDVLAEYEQAGQKLMENFRKSRQENRQQIQLEVGKLMKVMGHGYELARQEMSRITADLRACQVHELDKVWIEDQSRMQRLVEEGIGESM